MTRILIGITGMIYDYPKLEQKDQDVLGRIREQRHLLRHQVNQNPVRWTGFLRKNTFARAIQGSNTIEGFNANLAEAIAIIDDERPETLEEETIKALQGYRNAMTYVIRVHEDPHTEVNTEFIRGLHFMMLNYDMTKLPGQWRNGPIYVVREQTGDTEYEGPPADLVPSLMKELVGQINAADNYDSSTVLGAMAHLNLTMIHPFKDGNGRMARALQTLVISQNGVTTPVFCSIEEWLGRNTESYYAILKETGQGIWNPNRSALPWVRFCLRAHYQQAVTLTRRNAIVGRVWEQISAIVREAGLPDRVETPMMDAAFGYRVKNGPYRDEAKISETVASRDLKKLTELGYLVPFGEKRGRYYESSEKLKTLIETARDKSGPIEDPYQIKSKFSAGVQLSFEL
jgi:Fic family protein